MVVTTGAAETTSIFEGNQAGGRWAMDFPNKRVQEMGYERRWFFSFRALLPRRSRCGEDSSQVTQEIAGESPYR